MKQSIVTGLTIYKELFELNKELEEAEAAAKLVADELGEYTSAYKILSKAVADLGVRLKAAEGRRYTEALITYKEG